jgi:hypothetical protein
MSRFGEWPDALGPLAVLPMEGLALMEQTDMPR